MLLGPAGNGTALPQGLVVLEHRGHVVVGLVQPLGGEAQDVAAAEEGAVAQVAVVLHRRASSPRPDVSDNKHILTHT